MTSIKPNLDVQISVVLTIDGDEVRDVQDGGIDDEFERQSSSMCATR